MPFDYGKVIKSIEKTHRILLTSDACDRGSALHTLGSKIAQFAFHELDSPPTVVGSKNWITPPADLEEAFFPHASDIIDAVHEHLMPLEGYTPTRRSSVDDLMQRSAEGI